jgi:hypothetical protein
MRGLQRGEDGVVQLLGVDGFEAQFGDSLLPPALADRGRRVDSALERARSLRIPGTALVIADSARARGEERVADVVEGLARYEDDELAVQISLSTRPPLHRRDGTAPPRRSATAIGALAGVTLESGWRRGVAPGATAPDPRTGRSGLAAACPSSRRRSTSTPCRSRAPPGPPRGARCRSPSCRRTGGAPPPRSSPR